MATNAIPPIPIRTPMSDAKGMISPQWLAFIREIYNRVGGATGTTLTTVTSDLTAAQANITTLQSEIGALGVGRAL